jgi:hypothetical protein
MGKKIMVLGVVIIMGISLFGCSNKLTIRDFDGLSDLPVNPDRIVFSTVFSDEDQTNEIEVDVPMDKIDYVMDILFSRTYKVMPKNIEIDPLPDFIRIYKGEKTWRVSLGVIRHNERWYDFSKDNLLTYLHSLV